MPIRLLPALTLALTWADPLCLTAQNAIDSLQTQEQVQNFIHRFDKNYDSTSLTTVRWPITDLSPYKVRQFGAVPYEKGDFDGNGTTDLLHNGYLNTYPADYAYPKTAVILSFGRDSFRITDLTRTADRMVAKKIVLGGHDYISTLSHQKIDTLRYFEDCWLDHALRPHPHTYQQIKFCSEIGFYRNQYRLIISGDTVRKEMQTTDSTASRMWSADSISILTSFTARKLYAILNTVDFTELEDSYEVSATDNPSSALRIDFDKDEYKCIYDYGLRGTFSLAALYQLLDEIQATQHYKPIDTVDDNGSGSCNDGPHHTHAPRASPIDTLQTDPQVEAFLRRFDKDGDTTVISTSRTIVSDLPANKAREFGATSFEKGDFDGNGTADLLFNGYVNHLGFPQSYPRTLVVLCFGPDSFRVTNLTDMISGNMIAKKIVLGNLDYISTFTGIIDTLQLIEGVWLDHTAHAGWRNIHQIQFCRYTPFIPNENYSITIHNDSATIQISKFDTDGVITQYTGAPRPLPGHISHMLSTILYSTDFPNLRDNYLLNQSDNAAAYLRIDYDNDEFKSITDNTLKGSFSLSAIYQLMSDLATDPDWKLTNTDSWYPGNCAKEPPTSHH